MSRREPDLAIPRVQEALIHACNDGDLARVEQVLAAGAAVDFEAPESGGVQRPLFLAATRGNARLFQLLIAHGADPRRATAGGETPLREAARHDHLAVVEQCLELDRSSEARDDALRIAAGSGSARTVQALLARGADPKARSATGRTALHCTAQMRQPAYDTGSARAIVTALLDHGSELHEPTEAGETLFHLACANELAPESWLDTLVELGARVDDPDAWGMTPLWTAARANQTARVIWLLAHGAEPNAQTTNDSAFAKAGVSVYEIARRSADLKLLAALRDAGAKVPASARAPAPAVDPFRVGAVVAHPKFGSGKVIAREGSGASLKLTIEFADGAKILLAKFVSPGA